MSIYGNLFKEAFDYEEYMNEKREKEEKAKETMIKNSITGSVRNVLKKHGISCEKVVDDKTAIYYDLDGCDLSNSEKVEVQNLINNKVSVKKVKTFFKNDSKLVVYIQ